MKAHEWSPILALSIMALAAVTFVGCTSAPPAPPPVAHTPVPHHPPVVQPAPPPVAYKPMADDKCGAEPLQYLVGKPRTDIPVPLYPAMRRVVCSTCIVTQEYRNDRQTIIFDTDTGIIRSVACG